MLVCCGMSSQAMENNSAVEQVMATWMGHSYAGLCVGHDSNFITSWDEGCSVGFGMVADIGSGSNVCAGKGLRGLDLCTTR